MMAPPALRPDEHGAPVKRVQQFHLLRLGALDPFVVDIGDPLAVGGSVVTFHGQSLVAAGGRGKRFSCQDLPPELASTAAGKGRNRQHRRDV